MFRGIAPHNATGRRAIGLLLALLIGAIWPAYARPVTAPALRVVVLPNGSSSLHTAQAARLLEDFAASEGRKLHWSVATHPAELYARLTTDQTDLVVGTLPQELAVKPELAATSVVATERYVVVGRRSFQARNPLELRHARLAMSSRAPLWDYFNALARIVPGLEFSGPKRNLSRGEALQLVADDKADVAVVALGSETGWLGAELGLEVLFDLTGSEPVEWYVRRSDDPLRQRLNAFIDRFHTAYLEPTAAPRDFSAIRRSGVLRVITRVERPNYFIEDGRPQGFEYEIARAFADRHDLRLEVLVARDDEQMRDWLRQGMGDLITARLTPGTEESAANFKASRHYHYTAYTTLSRPESLPRTAAELAGRRIAVTEDSPEWRALQSMDAGAPRPALVGVNASIARATLFKQVAAGLLDATVVAGDDVASVLARYPTLAAGVSIPHRYDYRWLARRDDPRLLDAVDQFLGSAQTDGLETMLAARYFDSPRKSGPASERDTRLSPFDPIVQRYAERYGFDWRLIAAQMYQESLFDPGAISRSGAIGLMQILPATAEALGFDNVKRPESAIHAGVKYLYTLRNEFDEKVPVGERTWFALAAYNLGSPRVEKARALAGQMGLDPNRWSGNVENAMRVLARQAANGGDSRYGQALIYVRSIQLLYGGYRNLLAVSGAPRSGSGVPSA